MADVLKSFLTKIANGANTAVIPSGVNSTKTLLSCIVHNSHASTDITFKLIATDSAGDHTILHDQSLPAKSTFIWNSKIVFVGTAEYLKVDPSASVINIDVVTSYLDQTS